MKSKTKVMTTDDELQAKRKASQDSFLTIAKAAYERKLVQKTSHNGGVSYTFTIPHERKDSANFDLYCIAAPHDM